MLIYSDTTVFAFRWEICCCCVKLKDYFYDIQKHLRLAYESCMASWPVNFYDRNSQFILVPIIGSNRKNKNHKSISYKLYYLNIQVCKYVCKYICTSMRFVVPWDMKLKLGMGRGRDGPTRIESISSKRPDQRSKVIQRSSYWRYALWPPNLVGRTPDRSEVQCWGQRSYRGQLGVILLRNAP